MLFLLIVASRRLLYRLGFKRSHAVGVPVIVVGNIFVGGTGKTPLTIWLVEALTRRGFRPGVVSRGYGANNTEAVVISADSVATVSGDEPLLIAQRTASPVVVGRNRVEAARVMRAQFPEVDVIVADDGLQHYRLARDVEIVLSDERGNGNGWLLPAGPLREPAGRRRDFTVINVGMHGTMVECVAQENVFAMCLQAEGAYRLGDPGQWRALAEIASGSELVAAAAGIGNPERFFSMLRGMGIKLNETLPLPDHFDFQTDPFAQTGAAVILITEKDAVKCSQFASYKNDPRMWVVPIDAQIDEALANRIVEKCRGSSPA